MTLIKSLNVAVISKGKGDRLRYGAVVSGSVRSFNVPAGYDAHQVAAIIRNEMAKYDGPQDEIEIHAPNVIRDLLGLSSSMGRPKAGPVQLPVLKIPQDLKDKLDRIASREGVTVSEIRRRALWAYVEK